MNRSKTFSILALLLASLLALPAQAATCGGTGRIWRIFAYVPSGNYTPILLPDGRMLRVRASQLSGTPIPGYRIQWSGGTTTDGGKLCSLLVPPAKVVVLGL